MSEVGLHLGPDHVHLVDVGHVEELEIEALGTGLRRGVFWRDMGVVNQRGGRPTMALTGGALSRLEELTPAGMSPQDVATDILTHLIPGAVVVPSMVASIAVLQSKYRYTYATLTF